MLANVPMVFILVGIAAYTVLSGADFGAGLWTLVPGGGRAGAAVTRDHTRHAIGPVWEANHVWLIFVLTVAWTCYPVAFGSIVSTLAIPLFIAAIGIIFRGTAYALRSQFERAEEHGVRLAESLFALSSVLTPFALATVIGAIATGRVPVGNARGDLVTSWLNPVSILAGVLAVAFSGYLAAVYLAADARRLAERSLVHDFRVRALVSGVVAGALALAGLLVIRASAPALWQGLTSGLGLALVIVSAVAGVVTVILVWRGGFGLARASAALAVAAVIAGWADAQAPYVLPGLTVAAAAAGRSTLIATIVGVAVGAVVLVPSLAALYSLVLRGRLDTAEAADDGAAVGGGAAADGSAAVPGGAGRRAQAGAPRDRLAGAFAVAALVAGTGLLVFADPAWAHGLGAVALIACAVTVFALAARPASELPGPCGRKTRCLGGAGAGIIGGVGGEFVPGVRLAGEFYAEAVRPVLEAEFPGLAYAAALIGPGSEVLGFDTERSTDHDWGPRLLVFLEDEDAERLVGAVDEMLGQRLPAAFRGYPVAFGVTRDPASGTRHRVEIFGLGGWLAWRLGFDPRGGVTVRDWLAAPWQRLAEVTAGAVFHDGTGGLTRARTALSWYPRDLWRYVLSCQWSRIAEEEAFGGRCAEAGDELGSAVVTARLARDLMRLWLLMHCRYPPYSKWLGSALARAPGGAGLGAPLTAAVAATGWPERERQLGLAYRIAAEAHNRLGLTEPLDPGTRPYYTRPYQVLDAGRFAAALSGAITDPLVAAAAAPAPRTR